MNKTILRLVDLYIKENKYSLVQFQQYILDEFEIESSVGFGDNDTEEYIEIYGDDILRINNKGDLINGK